MALYREDYSISRPRVGDARLSNLRLQTWSNDPQGVGVTESGRMYWEVTTGNVINLHNDEGRAAAALMAFGTITNKVANLTAANGSALTLGRVEVDHTLGELSTGDLILFYGDEPDLIEHIRDVTDLLDKANQWLEAPRFEKALNQAKRLIDNQLMGAHRNLLRRKSRTNELDLADIAMPRQLAEVQAMYTGYILEKWRSNNHPGSLDHAHFLKREADKLLASTAIALDFQNDDIIDVEVNASGGRMIRG